MPCRIEAVNSGDATEYRHRLATREVRFRVVDEPHTRVELWDTAGGRWRSARSAAAFFALNALCLDGTSFCAINPNYLNSVEVAGDETVRFTAASGDSRFEATAQCRDGELNGREPASAAQAQLLHAACQVAFGT